MTTICTDVSGTVVMWSDDGLPTPPGGGARYILTDAQKAVFTSLRYQSRSGITFDGVTFAILPYVAPPSIDMSDLTKSEKVIRAAVLAAAIMSGKTVAEAQVAFRQAWNSLSGV